MEDPSCKHLVAAAGGAEANTTSAGEQNAALDAGAMPLGPSSLGILRKPYLLPKENPLHVPPHVAISNMEDELELLKKQIYYLKQRNMLKDKGKKFEGSYTRIGFIMIITYGTISVYMYLIGVKDPLLNAIVPTVGFNLSTWSLPYVKKVWMAFYDWNYGRGRKRMTLEELDELDRIELGISD